MRLDTFLEITEKRLPTVPEMVSLCDTLGVTFGKKDDGTPYMRPCPEGREETMILATLFRREPFRSQVISAKGLQPATETPKEDKETLSEEPLAGEDDEPPDKPRIVPPPGAEILVADERGYTNQYRKGDPYMWCWIPGCETWHYVKEHPLP